MIGKKIVGLLCCFLLLLRTEAQNLDIDIVKNINPRNPHSDYWKFTSGSAYFISAAVPVSLLVTGFINRDKALRRKSYEIFGSIIIEVAITETAKTIIGRDRPAERYPLEVFPYRQVYGKSFPSGHTSLAFATATSLSLQFKKWYVTLPALVWATSVGYSRIYLGVHYPSDVLSGALAGAGSALLSHWLNKKLFIKKSH